jgi:hypothetical protein
MWLSKKNSRNHFFHFANTLHLPSASSPGEDIEFKERGRGFDYMLKSSL